MYLSELQNKDIISINNGMNLGRIIDVEINSEGRILNFVAQEKKFFRKVLKNSELTFSFNDIVKIGKDVILVNK
ncbi:MAG: YlmC/YmxH family sporulation protein [Bacilli bacterium]